MLIGRLDETIHGVTDWRSFCSFFVARGFALSSPIIICFPDSARGHLRAPVFRPKVLLKQRHPAGIWKWRITWKENKRFVCWSSIFSFNWKATLSGKTTIKRPVSYHLKKKHRCEPQGKKQTRARTKTRETSNCILSKTSLSYETFPTKSKLYHRHRHVFPNLLSFCFLFTRGSGSATANMTWCSIPTWKLHATLFLISLLSLELLTRSCCGASLWIGGRGSSYKDIRWTFV